MNTVVDVRAVRTLTAELIACRTENPPGDERVACEPVARYLAERGVEAHIHDLGNGRANLVARIRGGGGPGLMLSGHLDVVPAEPEDWTTDPFCATEDGDRLTGRGSTDMKGAIAAMAIAIAELSERRAVPRGDIVLALTAGEEVDSLGARRLVSDGLLDGLAWVVIGEPTCMDVGVGHKGALWVAATAAGIAAHGSQPELGDNAILKLLRWLFPTDEFNDIVAREPDHLLGAPTFSLNMIDGGRAPNVVPDRARALLDFRTLPGQSHGNILIDLGMRSPTVELEIVRDAPGVLARPEGTLVQAACAACAVATGREPARRGLPFVTDGSVYGQALGAEVVLVGPGDEARAHQKDEWVSMSALDEAVATYGELADRLLYR